MKSEYICIVCPNGCELLVEYEDETFLSCTGNLCRGGLEYAKSMITDPKRSVTSTVLLDNGSQPLLSVRTDKPISKKYIFDVMKELKNFHAKAPVKRGEVLIPNILNLGSDIIATQSVD